MVCGVWLSPKGESVPFEPVDFYALASWLYDTKPSSASEALRRTIIGRAYYAALICARDHVSVSTTGAGGHSNVIDALKKVHPTAARKLDALRLSRRKADYEVGSPVNDRDVGISLGDALVVLRALGKAPTSIKPYSTNYLDPQRFLP